jgi:hypothetical protein
MSGVSFEPRDRIALIPIDRPAAGALAVALDELSAREDLAIGVLTRAGLSLSCGRDLKAVSAGGERPDTESHRMFGITQWPPDKPLIAGLGGHVDASSEEDRPRVDRALIHGGVRPSAGEGAGGASVRRSARRKARVRREAAGGVARPVRL